MPGFVELQRSREPLYRVRCRKELTRLYPGDRRLGNLRTHGEFLAGQPDIPANGAPRRRTARTPARRPGVRAGGRSRTAAGTRAARRTKPHPPTRDAPPLIQLTQVARVEALGFEDGEGWVVGGSQVLEGLGVDKLAADLGHVGREGTDLEVWSP